MKAALALVIAVASAGLAYAAMRHYAPAVKVRPEWRSHAIARAASSSTPDAANDDIDTRARDSRDAAIDAALQSEYEDAMNLDFVAFPRPGPDNMHIRAYATYAAMRSQIPGVGVHFEAPLGFNPDTAKAPPESTPARTSIIEDEAVDRVLRTPLWDLRYSDCAWNSPAIPPSDPIIYWNQLYNF